MRLFVEVRYFYCLVPNRFEDAHGYQWTDGLRQPTVVFTKAHRGYECLFQNS